MARWNFEVSSQAYNINHQSDNRSWVLGGNTRSGKSTFAGNLELGRKNNSGTLPREEAGEGGGEFFH